MGTFVVVGDDVGTVVVGDDVGFVDCVIRNFIRK